jgi:AcrR family transcriptional regulator
MAASREPRVKADARRAQARDVALTMMRNGVSYKDLTLRDIASQLGIPLSTLTYAYVSVGALLDDFQGAFNAPLVANTTYSFWNGLLALAFWGYMLFCGIRAYRGQDVKLPLISALLGQPGGQ